MIVQLTDGVEFVSSDCIPNTDIKSPQSPILSPIARKIEQRGAELCSCNSDYMEEQLFQKLLQHKALRSFVHLRGGYEYGGSEGI